MENTVTPSTEETKEQTAPTLERIAELNSLDKEFLDYTKGNLSVDPEASFEWLDDWSERRFGIRGEKGSAWLGSRKEYPNPNAYADALTGLVTRGYEAIATPEYNAYIAAEKSGNREEMIKAAGISLTKRGEYVSADGLPIGSQDIPKTDEEIDNELKEYGRKIKLQNFSAHFLTFADDFTPDEKEIVYASLRYGDGLPAEKEADYLAVWRDNPEKAARLHYLVELSRKNEYAWMRDNLVHPFVTGIENIRYGIGDELGDFAEFQGAISAMKEIVSRDGERRMWNEAERKLFRDLEARKATRQMELSRRGLGNSAMFQTFTSAADEGVANPKAYVDEICARRMAREALPREEQLKRRKEELMLRLATSHKPYDDYDPVSNAISGAIGTIPYMAAVAAPYVGPAIGVLSQFGNVRNDILLNGGNPDDAVGAQLLSAGLYMAIEKQQLLTLTKPLTGLQKKAILERIAQTAWKNGKLGALGSAIRQGAPEFVAKTFAECVEEGLQGAVEGGTKQWWMPEEKGGGDWTKTISAALTQGGKDFVESIGTMGLLSLVGGVLNQTQARRNALSVESLVDYASKKMQVMNIMSGRVKEMVDEKNIPANAQKMHNEVVQIWQAHKGNAVAALDEMREKYGLTDDQARTVGDYLDLQSTLLNIARTSQTDEEANAIASFAGGAYRVGQTTGMGDTAYDVTDLFRMISPNITVEDIEVDDRTKSPIASPAVENLRQERDAALKRIEEAKVGSQRKAAERELRRINKRLKAAEAKENAVSYPKMTMRRVTIPVGKNSKTRSFVIREDNEAPDIHSAGYAISVADAVKGAEDTKDGKKVSIEEFKALPLEQKLGIAVTQDQYMAMNDDERAQYVSRFGLGGSGSFTLLDNTGKEIFNSDAIVKLFRGKVGTPGARIGGNWSLAHEYTHGVVRFLRDIDAIDEGTVALMRRLFGEPTSDNELWNEEAMANGFAEFLRGEFDFRRLTPEERREAMGFFERVWDIIKDFFRRIFGKEIDEPPVVANTRKEAERAVFNALRNGDLSGLDQYAGIEFEEEKREERSGKREDKTQDAQKQPSTPSEEKTANEQTKSEERAPIASTPSNTAKDAPKEPAKAKTTPTADVAAVVEQIENPIATAANLPARTNTKMTIFTPGYEMEIECEMMWVPLDELAESTDDREVQMRDRTRRATDEQVRTKTRKGVFQPLALFPGKKSDDGAPIVGGGMKIISGHGRKRMLEQLAAEGRFGEYLSAINAEAQRQGVPTAPEGMKNPVLVLRVTGGLDKKSDLNRFAELSNRWGGLERSGAELAESDARKITDALLRLYAPDNSGNLLAASNRPFMTAFLKEVGATGLTNADGTPTPEAALRVQRALMTAIFGNDEKIRAIIQNLLEKSGELSLGNLQNALMRSAGKLLAMKRAKGSFDIVNDVREAAYHYIAWRSAQQKQKSLSFADFLNEQDMFTAGATPMQAALAKLLEVGRFGTVLDEYAKLVAQEAVDAQGSFDFAEKRTPLQLLGFAERNTLAEEETPVTPDPTSAEAAEPVQTPPAASEEELGVRNQESGVSTDPSVLTPNPSLTTAQAVITPPEPETFTPAPLVRGTATLPGPGAEGIKAHQVNANGEPTTRVKTLPAGAWNLLRAPYDVRRPPKASAQDNAGRGLKISNPPPVKWNDIFPHFQGNKTEMADRTSQAIRTNMTKAEREHYTTVVDYFGGGGCWGLFHTLANFPNAKTLVINEFDPDRLGKIRLLQEIDGEVAEIAYKLLDERYEEIRVAAKDSSSPATITKVVESQFKRFYTDPTERAAIQAFIDCAHTLLATSKDAQGNVINDTRLGIRRAVDTLREDGRKAKEAADAFKAREGATIRYVSGDAVANADTLPHGDDVIAIADPPYYLTADYQQNTILGLEKVPDNWSYRATQEFLHKLVDSGDGLVYTDEAWWFKEAYSPDQQEDLFGGGSTFAKEQEILLDIINTLDHFDVAGRVVGRQEVLGVHHGHTTDTRTENGENGNAVRHDAINNAGGGRGAGSPVLGVATEPQAQSGNDGAFSAQRGRDGAQPAAGRAGTPAGGLGRPDDAAWNGTAARASVIASGRRALAREVIIQDVAASIESAATEIAQGATVDTDAISRLARYSVRQVREERMAEYAEFVSKNAKAWLKHATKRLDERMKEAGYTEKVWHGTYGEDFNVFKFSANSHDVPAAYFTYNRGTAQNYAALVGVDYVEDEADEANLYNTRQFYINPGKVLDLDEAVDPTDFYGFVEKLKEAYAQGYNAVRVKNALDDQGARLDEFDNGPMYFLEEDEVPGDAEEHAYQTDILIVMQQPGDNAQARIKAADAVTFDDDGLPIPLEMRVDQSMSDIRFSVTPSLVAVKNFTKKDLLKDFARGYTINPSAAVIAAGTPFSEYGEITAVYSKDSFANDPAWEQDAGTYVQNGKIYSDLENDAPNEYKRYTIDTLDEKSLFEPDLSVRQVLEKRIGKRESYIREELGWQYAEVKKAGKLAISEIKALVVPKDIGDDIVELAKEHNIPIYTYNGKGIEVEKDWFNAHGTNSKDRARIVKKIATDMNLRFSVQMGKRAREEAAAMIRKYRPDLAENDATALIEARERHPDVPVLTEDENVIQEIWDTILPKAVDHIAEFETPKERKAALHWFIKGSIRLPEDAPKVTEAIKTAERAKVDPMQYDRPGDILEEFSKFRPKEPPINPDTVPELSDKRDMGSGVTTYLVQDDKAGQLAMRKIINTHWGKDANPWCLLQGDGNGNLSDGSNGGYDAWHYWQHYNALPKRVAFQDGKLLAFMATTKSQNLTSLPTRQYDSLVRMYETETGMEAHDKNGDITDAFINWYNDGTHQNQEWWDRVDESHDGIPMKRETKSETEYGASTTTETIELMQDGTEVTTSKKRESIAPDGTRTIEEWGDNGDPERYERRTRYPSGMHENTVTTKKHDVTHFSTVTNNIMEIYTLRLSDSTTKEIAWEVDFRTTLRLVSGHDGYTLYRYELGAFRETDQKYTPDMVEAWLSSAEAALRRGEAIPPLPGIESASTTPRWSVVTSSEDAAYMDAVKHGDMETAQRMVREAAERAMPDTKIVDNNGDPLRAYHATDNDFTVFDKRRLGEFTDKNAVDDAAKQLARLGFWFNENDLHKQIWAKKAVSTYLNVTNPYETSLDELWSELREQKAESFVSDLKARGHDGIVLDDSEFGGKSFVVFESNQIKSANPVTYDDAGYVIPLSQRFNPEKNDIRYSVTITRPWRKDFPNATVMTTRKAILEKHGDLFTKAKAGDVEAAADLIDTLMSDKKRLAKVRELKRRHPEAAFVAAVHAEEATGRNKIPQMFAKFIARAMGITTDDSIVQTVRAEHSGADAWHRITHRAQFAGIVERGKEYILVDDHITQGGTLNELRSYIENEGGKVVDVIALTSSKGSTILVPRKETIDELKTRYPDINRLLREADIAGRVEALTNSEAEYIKTFSPDTFRDRVAQAGQERGERLRGQALGEPPSDSVARTAWSETPEERETMRNSVFMGARGAVRTDKLDSLDAAVERFKEKHSENYTDKARDDIYINTGWWQGTDGQWRVEIPDMRIKTVDYLEDTIYNWDDALVTKLENLVSNTRLFKAYPDLKRLPIAFLPDESNQLEGIRGAYTGYEILLPYDALTSLDPDAGEIRLTKDYLRTLTHEVQHAIQHIEGFAPGGNRKDHGSRNYARLAGEVEARNAEFRYGGAYGSLVSARQDEDTRRQMIESRMAPWQTEDVPTLKQILINEDNKMTDVRGNQIERHHVRRGRTPRSIDDTLTSYVAAQIMGGTDVTIEDMRKIVSSASSGTRAADILERAKTLANDNRAKAVAKAASSVAETSARLGDLLESDRLGEALSQAVTMGAKAASPEIGRKLQQAIEQKRIRDLQSAEGFTAAEIMAELPISLADGVFATAELERTPEELAKLEAAKKEREEERAKKLETEEGAEELADPETPMREPTEAERKAVDDLLDRARMRDDLAKQEEERKRAEKKKREAAEAGDSDTDSDAGGDAADDISLLPEEAVRRIAPVFESADVFSWFIIELTSDKTLEKHPELLSTGEMWKSPVAVRELKKTAADILRRLAKDTLGSPSINYARNLVDRAINELESDLETKTFNSVRRKIAHIYTMIWDNAHRITKNELMKEIEKTISKLTQKGRFSYTQEEMERDIPAKIERWAKWVLKYARMGEAKLQDEIANLEKLTSENPASEDGKMPTPVELAEAADKLAVAKVYGHLKGKSIGEMRDLIDQIATKLDGERQAFELRRAKIEEANKTIVDALVNALTQGKANRRNKAKAKGIIDRAMELMISSIDQQMVDLVRFCTDPELRKKALEAIDELTILINEGGNRYRNTLATAQDEIHDGLKACYDSAENGIRHLHEELPPEIVEQFFRQSSDQKRTYGHLLQLYASCLQRDYAENIHKHGRDEQIAAMEAALTAQDKMFHTWAVNWYKHNRKALSDAVEEVTGLPVIAPDELYVPVRVETEPSGIPAEVVAWSPVPRALSRRVRHGLDFDENAHFLSMVNEQAEIRAQTIGYAMTGIILRDTIASRDVQTAARRNASPSDMNAVILHLRDILAQGAGQEKSVLESLKVLRKWAARFNIAWNPSSALAQPASIPVWANVLLDGEAWGATSVLKAMASAATEEGRAAIAELRASDGYRARYALGWSEEVANVFANPNEKKLLSKLGAAYDKGMMLSQFTDAACSLWIAQGFYRHATDVFVRRGETIEEAKRKALALTWAAVEQTQQSGRTENLSALQRGKGKNIINAILQFKTAQVLQNSYIIRAIRDIQAGVPGAKGRLLRAIFISTVWVPGYLSLKGALWALIMGVKPEPDDEEEMPLWFREMLYSAVDGMTAPLFVTSTMAEAPLRKMLKLKSYGSSTGIAALDTWNKLGMDIYRMMTDPIMLEEELTSEKIIDDIWKVIGDISAPVRHVRKAINNRRED